MGISFPKKQPLKVLCGAIALICAGHVAPADAQPKHIAFVFDLHTSSPARDPNARENALRKLNSSIAGHNLGNLDYITIQTAGDASLTRHSDPKWNRTVKLRHGGARARDVPGFIASRINDLANQPAHSSSKLIWALSELRSDLNCATQETTVYVLSDVVSGGAVAGGYWEYESFANALFTGCKEIVFVGLGTQYAGNPHVVTAAKAHMLSTMSAAGFKNVSFR